MLEPIRRLAWPAFFVAIVYSAIVLDTLVYTAIVVAVMVIALVLSLLYMAGWTDHDPRYNVDHPLPMWTGVRKGYRIMRRK